jgi:hypothetical protein
VVKLLSVDLSYFLLEGLGPSLFSFFDQAKKEEKNQAKTKLPALSSQSQEIH